MPPAQNNGNTTTARQAAWLPALWSRELTTAVALAIGYYVGVQVGFALTFESSPVSTMWPPNAILLAGLLLTTPRMWWLMIAAVLPAHFAAELSLGVPWNLASCWFLSNVAEALIGAALIVGYLGGPPRLDRVRDLSVFIIAGVAAAPTLSSFLDASFVASIGWRDDDFWAVWRLRLFSNALATLTLVPLILMTFRNGARLPRRPAFRDLLEAAVLLAGTCAASLVVFERLYSIEFAMYLYLPLPFLMWAAVRYGVTGVSLCAAIVTGFAIVGVLENSGTFPMREPENAARSVQVFLIIAESSLMLLAAALAEARHARTTAARQEERLNLALDAAEMGAWEWDIGLDRVTWHSPREEAAEPPSGAQSRSSHSLLKLVHEGDRAMVRQAIEDALKKRGGGEVECRFIHGRRRYRWIASKGRVLSDVNGDPARMIGVFLDTTKRKDQELQTRAQREQLAHLSRVSMLGELSAAIAHELNQPLTSILLNAQTALREIQIQPIDAREIGEILEEIVAEDKRAGEVIRRLRTLLLRGAVEMQPVDVNECIEEVLRLEQTDLIAHRVRTNVRLEKPGPSVIGDRVQLQQVLLNFVVNARDAMAENRPEDRMLRITSVNGGSLVFVDISDSGHGVDDIEMIFEPFFSTKERGIGMGLSICRTIVAAHGGRVWASNNATRGATLHMSLPTAPDIGKTITPE